MIYIRHLINQIQVNSNFTRAFSFIISFINLIFFLISDQKKNKIAERILFQLKQKLLGYENGAQLSTNGHINNLINEAINPENLCRIYVGWQPYL